MEYVLDQRAVRVGRGPGVDLAIDDPSLQTVHARIEFENGAFRVHAVAPEAQLLLNGGSVTSGELKADDHLELGSIAFSFALEPRALPRSSMR
jgi:predicted component of type VI protein secretion system